LEYRAILVDTLTSTIADRNYPTLYRKNWGITNSLPFTNRSLTVQSRDGTGNGKRPVRSGPVRYRSGISDRPVYRHRSRFLSFIYFARKTAHKRRFFWKSKNFFSVSEIIFVTGHSFNYFTQSGIIIKLRNTSLIDFYIEIFSQNY
jgi:hypothetical protein